MPTVGDRIDGFEIEARLGAGAMGVVLLARDSELGRNVAIKLLLPREGDKAQAQQRLLREAQSVAQLQHPNVVALHQVGIHDGQVYLVMEFVDGGTLRQWGDAQPRPWHEVVNAYRQAGAGLAAAHAAGLIHRDFKPDNVLIGKDGRVRVSDFGLVGAPGSSEQTSQTIDSVDVRLTQTGAVLGTPAYMAPEQFAGTNVGPAADQFAFCVSLYQGLFGRRPFRGDNAGALMFAIEAGEIQPPPRGHRVPARIRAAIERGLHPDPAQRHASVAALIDLLETAPRRRFAPAVALLGVAAVGAAAWWGAATGAGGGSDTLPVPDAVECPAEDTALPEWTAARRAALLSGLGASDGSDAKATAERAVAAADERAAALAQLRHTTCVATGQRPQTERALARRCVEEEVFRFGVVVDLLAQRVRTPLAMASPALLVEGTPARTCVDEATGRQVFFDPTDAGPDSVERHTKLVEARLHLLAGLDRDASALATSVLDGLGADETTHEGRTLAADAHLIASVFSQASGDQAAAEAHVRASVTAARAAGDSMRESVALADLIAILVHDGRAPAALALAEQAEAASEAAGPDARWRVHMMLGRAHQIAGDLELADAKASLAIDDLSIFGSRRPLARIAVHEARAEVLLAQQRWADAAGQFAAALEASAVYGEQHPRRAEVLRKYGSALHLQGDVAGAQAKVSAAIEILEIHVETHAEALGLAYAARAEIHRRSEAHDAAQVALTRAIALFDRTPRSEELAAQSLINLGIVEFMRGDNEAADAALSRAAGIAKKHPNSARIDIARLEGMAGGVAIALGDLRRGLAHHQRALADNERRFGPTTLTVAYSHTNLGDIAMYLGECDLARASYRRALRIRADLGQPRDDEVVRIAAGQATCDAIDGDVDDAQDGLNRLAKEVAAGTAPWRRGRLEMLRAALAYRRGNIAAARAHAVAARKHYQSLGPAHTMDVDHTNRWLAEHR